MASGADEVPMFFPMYGLPLRKAVELESVTLHEKLVDAGALTIVKSKMVVLFLSHTWLGYAHPDPRGDAFRVLKRILRRLASGDRAIHATWLEWVIYGDRTIGRDTCRRQFSEAALWMDYWCVPQAVGRPGVAAEQQLAIQSIPAYVARADHFLVVAPPCQHVDRGEVWGLAEWRSRTWCRLEMLCHHFSGGKNVLTGESESQIRLASTMDWLANVPGEGELSCCRLGHRLIQGGVPVEIPCDKAAIREIVCVLYRKKLETCHADRDWQSFRLYQSLETRIFTGLKRHFMRDLDIDSFLARYKFSSPFQEEGWTGSGWSPLRLAAYEQNLPIMCALMDLKADVECPLRDERRDIAQLPGTSILAGILTVHNNLDVVQCLLDRKARLDAETHGARTRPAGHCQHPETLALLMQHGQSPNEVTGTFRLDLVHMALSSAGFGHGAPDMCCFLLKQGISPHNRNLFGFSHVHLAAALSQPAILHVFLQVPAEVAAARAPCRPIRAGRLVLAAMAARNRLSPDHPAIAFLSEVDGSTPLHLAASQGCARSVALLLKAGFGVGAQNRRGRTPVHTACLFGHLEALKELSEWPGYEQAAAVRCKHSGCTARQLAVKRGFTELLRLLPSTTDRDPDPAPPPPSAPCLFLCGMGRRAGLAVEETEAEELN